MNWESILLAGYHAWMLILASQSSRRREILAAAGIPFTVRSATVPEVLQAGEPPREYVLRLSREKAAAAKRQPGEIVLGADTVVVVDEQVLEKPVDDADATRMLQLLSGRWHEVMTGICLDAGESIVSDVAITRVQVAPLSGEEIAEYVASGEPVDKAGAYAIQGLASKFVDCIEGDHFNIVGLPVSLVYRHLRSLIPPRAPRNS